MRLIVALLLGLSAAQVAADVDSVEYSLFERIDAIGDHATLPLPGENECVLLQFWASWCHSCGGLMWDLDALTDTLEGVTYVAVSVDDDPSAAREYVHGHRLFEKRPDSYFVDTAKTLSSALNVTTVPSIFVLDSNGRILARKFGHLNSRDLQDLTDAIRSARQANSPGDF